MQAQNQAQNQAQDRVQGQGRKLLQKPVRVRVWLRQPKSAKPKARALMKVRTRAQVHWPQQRVRHRVGRLAGRIGTRSS